MQKYKVKVSSITPYLQHRMDNEQLEEWEKNRGLLLERSDVSKEDNVRAEFHSYRDDEGFYIPTEHIRGSFINAGAMVKSKVGNAKKSMKNIVAAMFFIEEEKLPLPKEYEIDKRSAVNHKVKARIVVIRPRWDNWKGEFTLLVDNDTITKDTIEAIIKNAGNFVGIGSFRPTANGYFGRFKLDKLERID
jgi:hypothetical protein